MDISMMKWQQEVIHIGVGTGRGTATANGGVMADGKILG
jgi:hypothetical protein